MERWCVVEEEEDEEDIHQVGDISRCRSYAMSSRVSELEGQTRTTIPKKSLTKHRDPVLTVCSRLKAERASEI